MSERLTLPPPLLPQWRKISQALPRGVRKNRGQRVAGFFFARSQWQRHINTILFILELLEHNQPDDTFFITLSSNKEIFDGEGDGQIYSYQVDTFNLGSLFLKAYFLVFYATCNKHTIYIKHTIYMQMQIIMGNFCHLSDTYSLLTDLKKQKKCFSWKNGPM